MPAVAQNNLMDDLLGWEANPNFSREVVDVGSNTAVVIGTVLGIVTASHKYVEFDPTASDGREHPVAVSLAYHVSDPDGYQCLVAKRACIVNTQELVWKDGVTLAQKTAAIEFLKYQGIVPR